MWDIYSDPARGAILNAQELASRTPHGPVGAPHLFLAVLAESGGQGVIGALLTLAGVKFEEAQLYGQSALDALPEERSKLFGGENWKWVMALAREESRRQGQTRVEIEHLFISSLHSPSVAEVVGPLGLEPGHLRQHLRGLNSGALAYREGSPLNRLTEGAKKSVEAAHGVMRASFCGRISTAHLLLGVLADEENTAVETLLRAEVDINALRDAARAQILSDGQIATPQKKFTAASKRVLERANRAADKCEHSFIGPQHLLYALLPHPTTIRENMAFGNLLDDPLEKVWVNFSAANIEHHYQEIWRNDLSTSPAKVRGGNQPLPADWIKTDWRWIVAGTVWLIVMILGQINPNIFLAGFGLAVLIAIGGGVVKVNSMRDRACSFICGTLIGIPVGLIFFAFFEALFHH